MKLGELHQLKGDELIELISKGETFVLYVRSERDSDKVKEIFDVDVVFPELAKGFGDRVKFFWCDINEVNLPPDLKIYFAPTVALFREGRLLKKLEGIKSWAEYNRALEELLC